MKTIHYEFGMSFQSFGPSPLSPDITISGWGAELRDGVTAIYGEMDLGVPLDQEMQENLPGLAIYIPDSGETHIKASPLKQALIIRAGHAYVYSADAGPFQALMMEPGRYAGLKLFFDAQSIAGLNTQAAQSYRNDPKRATYAEFPISREILGAVQSFSEEIPDTLSDELARLATLNRITAEILNLWTLIETDQSHSAASRIDAKIERADEYLRTHLITPPAVVTLANMVGLNHMTMKRGFRRLYGQTVYGRLRYWRMCRAKELLAAGGSVTEAALEVGYANPSKFAAAFKRETGHNPSESLISVK